MSTAQKETELNKNLESPLINYSTYKDESQLAEIKSLIDKDLSEPYSVYLYRYFLHTWGKLCHLAIIHEPDTLQDRIIGAVICKLDYFEATRELRGYIGMLAVDKDFRQRSIATILVTKCIQSMMNDEKVDKIALETEVTNTAALSLYEKLGFVRYKKLYNYYLNGVDAFRLILWVRPSIVQ